jgi:hypothetical protein
MTLVPVMVTFIFIVKSKINRGNAIGCRLLSLEEVDDCVWKVVLEGRERGVGQIIRLNIG